MPPDHSPTPAPTPDPHAVPESSRTRADTPAVLVAVRIPDHEWFRLHNMANRCDDDERLPLGNLRLCTIGGMRCWHASDGVLAVQYRAASDPGDYDLLVPPSMIRFCDIAVDRTGSAEIRLLEYPNGDLRIELTGPGGSVSMPYPDVTNLEYPDLNAIMLTADTTGARSTIRQELLIDLARDSRTLRHPLPDDAKQPVYALTLQHDQLAIDVDWYELGVSHYRVPLEGSGGPTRRRVSASRLELACHMFPNDEFLDLMFPKSSDDPVQITGEDTTVLLQPVREAHDPAVIRPKVERIINEALESLGATPDHNGEYHLSRQGVLVRGRIMTDAPASLRVFAVSIDGVDTSPELLRELNDLNASLGLARLFHANNQIRVEVDLLVDSLSADTLTAAIAQVRAVVERATPMLAVVFGGTTADDPRARRWEHYRTTVVEAEVSPGKAVCLNGPDAVADWPFPGPVYVITGWNPQGVSLGDDRHRSVNSQIARDIVALHGRFVHGEGRSPDGAHREPSLVAWGIPRKVAVRMGFRAQQDAIIEIDESEVRLLSCTDSAEESWGRLD